MPLQLKGKFIEISMKKKKLSAIKTEVIAMLNQEDIVLDEVEKLLASCPYNEEIYKAVIDKLNPLVIKTAEDEEYRDEMANSFKIWKQIKICLDGCIISQILKLGDKEHIFNYLRVVRGLVILMRNLSVNNQEIAQDLLIQNIVIRLFLQIELFQFTYNDMETNLYISICSFLHNINKKSMVFDHSELKSLISFLKYPIEHPNKKHELLFPYLLFWVQLVGNADFLYYFFRNDQKDSILYDFLTIEIMKDYSNISSHMKKDDGCKVTLNAVDSALLKIFQHLSYNESFGYYLENLSDKDIKITNDPNIIKCHNYLKILQLVMTGIEKWDIFQLTAIMTWLYKLFEDSCMRLKVYFQENKENEPEADLIHEELYIILDILSNLSKFDHVTKFLVEYNAVEKFVSLLQILQDNLIRINFNKDPRAGAKGVHTTDSLGDKIKDTAKIDKRVDYEANHIKSTNFPEIKLLLIEILANLTYKNKAIQDKMRELKGLQLVLSNCLIDDNDPFIKERSIVCIRFLLEGNEENQKFVANLEAKKAVQNEILDEAGYEVKIDNSGEIGLLPKKSG